MTPLLIASLVALAVGLAGIAVVLSVGGGDGTRER
jgi:hypothetical protein